MANLVDLDELALRCRDEKARQYIDEAVRCYKAGAYRSCIVSTWNAVVFDYLHKLRELEMSGDKNAQLRLEEFEVIRSGGESKLKEVLDFERTVLEVAATDFELLTPLEKIDLKRIQDDRNRCAHPSMQSPEAPYHPSAELARAHMRNAVEILLEKEPVQGKAAFSRICGEIQSKYFPTNKEAAIHHFKSGPLRRARKVLLRNLFLGITRSYLSESISLDERKRQLAAISAIFEMHRGVAEDIFRTDLPNIFRAAADEILWGLIAYCRRVPFAWDVMDEATRGRLRVYLRMVTGEDLLKAINYGIHVPVLKEIAISRLESVSTEEFAKLIAASPLSEYLSPAICRFESVRSWRSAENIAKCLILPLSEVFDVQNIQKVLLTVRDNDQIWDAGGMHDILVDFFDATVRFHPNTGVAWQDLLQELNSMTTRYSNTELQHKMEAAGMWPPVSVTVPIE